MDFKLNFQEFSKFLIECLDGMQLSSDCKNAINANAITIFNKANTTKQTDGSEEVLDTFEFQTVNSDIDDYIEIYNTTISKFNAERAKLNTLFKDFEFMVHLAKPDYFSITVNKEKMIVGRSDDGNLYLMRGDTSSKILKFEAIKSFEDLIQLINNPKNNFGKLGYKGLEMNKMQLH